MSEVADPPREPVPDRGIDRLVGFSDAVLAIAITLVALPLVDSAQALGTEPVAALFQHNSWALLSAASSFFAITLIWIGHNRLFDEEPAMPAPLLWINSAWLAAWSPCRSPPS